MDGISQGRLTFQFVRFIRITISDKEQRAVPDLTGASLFPVHKDTRAAARSWLENANPDDIISQLEAVCCIGLSYVWAAFFVCKKVSLWKNLFNCMGEWDGLKASLSGLVHEETPHTLCPLFAESISLILYIRDQFKKNHVSNLFTA